MNFKSPSLNMLLISLLFLSACTNEQNLKNHVIQTPYKLEIKEHNGQMTPVYKQIPTTQPIVALSFNGLANRETTLRLLDELDRLNLKATFFLPGMRVVEEPELAKEIKNRGHEIQNNTLNHELMSDMTYDETYYEIQLTNEIFKKELGITPSLVRSRSGDYTDNMRLVATQLGMKGVVSYSFQPASGTAETIASDMEKSISRGAIINLNPYLNEDIIDSLQEISKIAKEKNLAITTISDALTNSYTVLPLEEIKVQHTIGMNLNYENVTPNIFHRSNESLKKVAITFDDWASEDQLIKVLDVLDKYKIKSTFFLIGKGVEKSPNLAKLIVEKGHEVANHSYSHLDVTKMSPEELQQDIIKAHEIITEAIQQEPLPYFRPAKGIINKEAAKIIHATGIQTVVTYDVASSDWNPSYTALDTYNQVMERTRPGSVIGMHILDNSNTVEALPLIIEKLQSEGYTFVKMSEWIEPTGTDE